MNSNFSEKLRNLRKEKGVTQQALADAINEKRSSIANYESNNSLPGFEILNKLSDYFNVPVGYLTGKTNSLVSEYSFKSLEDYINILPKSKPLWIRIKNPIKYTSFTGYEVYAPNEQSKIEFYNPLEQKKKNKNSRIYLDFLSTNIDPFMNKSESYKAFYNFACNYGFLGEIFSETDSRLNENFTMFKPFEIGIIESDYYNPAIFQYDLLFKKVEYPYKEKYSSILEKNKITGYFEPINSFVELFNEMSRFIISLSEDITLLDSILEQISYRTGGIRKRFVKTDSGEIVESIGYKSLVSLMYYELFLDIKNGNIPKYCYNCRKFYLPNEKHNCKK